MSQEYKQPRFVPGQKVHYIGDPEGITEVVKSFSFDGEQYRYVITSRTFDTTTRRLTEGVMHVTEDELTEGVESDEVNENETESSEEVAVADDSQFGQGGEV